MQLSFFLPEAGAQLNGNDVIAVLPTGFGKSLLFQLLPNFLPVKADNNIVFVVCPLNSIIEDQLKVLEERGITADVLRLTSDDRPHQGKSPGNEVVLRLCCCSTKAL